ncbi:hypothetical protein PYW08_014985 [Mythimna loreyi]|uniref:Uncharacterized protein n=1 Tax=Mythimna loreyi TaxID=667449 RepID=A0ACC2R630_9NEOP|nr:hypothetical protein PYW08_014985 [Mythimna loreyi]
MSTPESKQNPTLDLKSRCHICLSSDRNLEPIKTEEKIILGILCPEMFFHNQHNNQYLYLMCWECKYMIIKIRRFQTRVSKAQAQMKLHLQGVKLIVDSISNLKIAKIKTLDLPPQLPLKDQNQPTLNEIPQPVGPILTLIKEEKEEQNTCDGNDYDEVIQPIKIPQPSSDETADTASDSEKCEDPLRTPKETTINIKTNSVTVIEPPQKGAKHAIISPNEKYKPQKVFIKAATENLVLRGHREAVKVTSGVPNLVTNENVPILLTKKASVLLLQETKHTITSTVEDTGGAFVENDKGSIPNVIKGEVGPTSSIWEVPILNILSAPICPYQPKEAPSRETECEQSVGMYGYDDDEEDQIKCRILNETELKTYRDKRRSISGYKRHPYKCDRCIKKFPNQTFLDQHNMKHDESRGPSMCKVCEQRFPNRSIRNEHYKEHFTVYECLKCQYQHNDKLETSAHVRRVHMVSVFNCKKCGAVFKTFREKRRHTLTVHSTSKKSTCEECGKTFKSLTLLKLHMTIHQKETTTCPVCKKKVRNNYFHKHMKTHDNNGMDSAYCVDCGKMFKSEKGYAFHLKTSLKHNTLEKIGTKCDHCNKYFHTKIALKDHLEEVTGIKYTCDICKKDVKNKTSLVRHIRIKHERREYQLKPKICEHCGKSFYNKQSLKQHINSHLGLRPYVCNDCGATFSYSGALFTHRKLVHRVTMRSKIPS